MSKKTQAIKAFEKHKARIDRYSPHSGQQWLQQLNDMTKLYLGETSAQYRALNDKSNFSYSLLYVHIIELNKNQFSNDLALKLIDNYIYYIKANGVYSDPKAASNVLGTLSNEVLLGGIITLFIAIGASGFAIGVALSANQKDLPTSTKPLIETPITTNGEASSKANNEGNNIVHEKDNSAGRSHDGKDSVTDRTKNQ